jgi:alpha-mannosidase
VDQTDDGGDAGLGVLNDCKYGHSCHDGVIGMSLLRAPRFPDETADAGRHVLAYSLMPHAGDWRGARVDAHAALFNAPLMVTPAPSGNDGSLGSSWAPFTLENGAGITVAAFKVAEEDERLILRLVETHGRRAVVRVRWNLPISGVGPVDLRERRSGGDTVSHDAEAGVTTLALSPFEIVTLAGERAG